MIFFMHTKIEGSYAHCWRLKSKTHSTKLTFKITSELQQKIICMQFSKDGTRDPVDPKCRPVGRSVSSSVGLVGIIDSALNQNLDTSHDAENLHAQATIFCYSI